MVMEKYSLHDFLNNDNILVLNKIVSESDSPLEGNCLYQHHKDFTLHSDNKEHLRKNLYTLCRDASSVVEVGFNAGHSCALYLYSNPKIEVMAFDLCEHDYSELCAEFLAKNHNVELIKGDSSYTIPRFGPAKTFDLIHIDGGHSEIQSLLDIINCRKFATEYTLLIVDDAYLGGIEKTIEYLSSKNFLIEVNYDSLSLIKTNFHRIFHYN